MTTLDPTRTLVLEAAAAHADGAVLPLPAAVRAHGAARRHLLDGLTRDGLVVAGAGGVLVITDAGRSAVGLAAVLPEDLADSGIEVEADALVPVAAVHPAARPAPRAGSKQALLAGLLRRQDGATIAEMTAATGWLPHTVRAALTGLCKRGGAITRGKRGDGTTTYRLGGEAG